jgi:hypothetical protein
MSSKKLKAAIPLWLPFYETVYKVLIKCRPQMPLMLSINRCKRCVAHILNAFSVCHNETVSLARNHPYGKAMQDEVVFQSADGNELAGVIHRPDAGPSKVWALFAHYFTCTMNINAAVNIVDSIKRLKYRRH